MLKQLEGNLRCRFGVFEFDAGSVELWKNGRPLKVRPQPLKLLGLLLARPQQLVSREQIQQELWGADVFVDFEQGVNHCVKQLRAALGDAAETPRFIQTIPRRGYRFIAPVERLAEAAPIPIAPTRAPEEPARSRSGVLRWALGATIAVTALVAVLIGSGRLPFAEAPAPPTLAVLPFDLLDTPPQMQYLGVSLADAVIARLAATRQVRIRPTSSVIGYVGHTDLSAAGKTLKVDYVRSGKLQREAHTHVVSLQMVRVIDGLRTWYETFRMPATDLLGLETAIASRAISALRGRDAAGSEARRTRIPAAYEAYLQGRFYMARFTSQDTLTAVDSFERALDLDAKYPLAHAGLAQASAQMYIRFGSEADVGIWKDRAERDATRALELDSTLAEAHEALAAVARYTEVDWDRAIEQSIEALRLNPSLDLPHYYLASALQHLGHLERVEHEVVAGLEANPLNLAEALRLRGVSALWSGRFSDAQGYLERVRALAAKPISDPHLAQALYYSGDKASAETMLAELRGSAQAEQRAGALLASFLAARGERRQAAALVDNVIARAYRDHHVCYSLGAAYAGLDQPSEAFQWLREAARTGFLSSSWYLQDPLLAPLRAHPDFQPFVTGVKIAADRITATSLRELQVQ